MGPDAMILDIGILDIGIFLDIEKMIHVKSVKNWDI